MQRIKADLSQIPCPFGDRNHASRVETGAVQINDDWPGVFIRGDNAMWFAYSLQDFIKSVENKEEISPTSRLVVEELLKTLNGCYISNVSEDDQNGE